MSKFITLLTFLSFLIACTKTNQRETLIGNWDYSFQVNAQNGYSEKSNGIISFSHPTSGTFTDVTNGNQANFRWALSDSVLLMVIENDIEYRFNRVFSSDIREVFILVETQEQDSLILQRID